MLSSFPFRMRFQRAFSFAPIPLPSPMQTHLWYVVADEVNDESLLRKYTEILSPDEKQNLKSIPCLRLQKTALLARALLRTTIARYQINCHVDPRSLKFKRNIHGKPEVEWHSKDGWFPPPLHFNISHTSSLIACGVTLNSQIGIDIEQKERKTRNDVVAFAQRYFSPHEVEWLSGILDAEMQRQEFIKLWTLKEAYVKALGKGFSAAPFKTFTIRIQPSSKGCGIVVSRDIDYEEPEILVASDDPKNLASNWQFALLELAGSHYAAICMGKDETSEAGIRIPIKLTPWKTIPFVEDECVSGTDLVVPLAGLVKLSD